MRVLLRRAQRRSGRDRAVAHGSRDANAARELPVGERLLEARDAEEAGALVGVAHEDRKLVPADPRDDVVVTHGLAKRRGDRTEELVADRVTVAVVGELEVIDVDEHDRVRLAGGAQVVLQELQRLVPRKPVADAGQRVRARSLGRVVERVLERERAIEAPPAIPREDRQQRRQR